MKMKRFFGILLGLALVLGLLPGMSVTAYAGSDPVLWVGDTQVVGGETPTTSGTGWSYDADTQILTLSGATINGVATEERIDAAIYAENMNLTIDVTGDSTVTGPNGDFSASAGIYVKWGHLTITGNKKLTAKGGTAGDSYGVYAYGNVTVNGTLEATGGVAKASRGVHANNVTVDGTLEATGG